MATVVLADPLLNFLGSVLLFNRLILATVMIYYGLPKIQDLKKNGEHFVAMGFEPGIFWGTIIAFVEFIGGLALLFGVAPEVWAALFGFQMVIGTIWKMKIGKPFTDYSYDLQLLAMSLMVVAYGGGLYTLFSLPLPPAFFGFSY